jgi:hypothetical protein
MGNSKLKTFSFRDGPRKLVYILANDRLELGMNIKQCRWERLVGLVVIICGRGRAVCSFLSAGFGCAMPGGVT